MVSYVLNGGPRPVADSTRQRVQDAIDTLQYHPSASARALRLQKNHSIGVLIPDISNPLFAEFIKVVQNLAFERGYSVIVGDTGLDPSRENAQVKSFLQRQIDGIIAYGIRDPAALTKLVESSVPLVSMDAEVAGSDVPTMLVDDSAAMEDLVTHVISHGHRRIAVIAGPLHLAVTRLRIEGWRTALLKAGLDAGPELITEAPFTRRGGRNAAVELLRLDDPPTAIVTISDVQAIGVLRACSDLGLRVPADIAVGSFDGTEESEYVTPPLTAVRIPLDAMALDALEQITDGMPLRHLVFPHELLIRGSCGEHPELRA